jgi:predicted TIM-barrel fold metal-dependent hydrolase
MFVFLILSCTTDPSDLYKKMTKVDSHVHIRTERTDIMEFAQKEGFKFLNISVGSGDQAKIDKQNQYARMMYEKYPESFSYITTFSMENFEEPAWSEEVIRKLKQDFSQGAIGVKVWKDIGMTFRDSLGNFIFIDDPRFDPIFNFIADNNKTVIGHIGEPKDCWLPLDSMHLNNHRNYYRAHPEYHMYLHPDYPSYDKIITSRDNMLSRYPDLRFIGAHLGSLEWSVDELAKRLDRYPNFAVDLAARVGNLQAQDRDKVRDFILKYQDRLLYATDFEISEEDDFEKRKASLEMDWKQDWKYFATDEIMESPDVNGSFKGLKLREDVLRKIYFENATKWIPGIFE